jgi:hypothetical protein
MIRFDDLTLASGETIRPGFVNCDFPYCAQQFMTRAGVPVAEARKHGWERTGPPYYDYCPKHNQAARARYQRKTGRQP